MVCDFCGSEEEFVRRIVMDADYDRLHAPALYACLECSIKKEEERTMNCERDI
tara:strand:+ start:565 stop:723 length:159 start_codon:yes stop_codon:yes gene_type:complete